MKTTRFAAALVCGATIAALSTAASHAYTTYAKWGSSSALFYINPANADLDPSQVEAALGSAMNNWNTQAGIPFRFSYAGRTGDTTTGYDSRNVMIFRNTSNGSAIATTYSWYSGSTLVDADIVFWDGAFTFTAGDLGCAGGVYLEDVATHELGHSLGLNHSGVADATMYPSYNYCSQDLRSLADDDIAGAQALYGASRTTSNTAPTVSITSPTSTAFTSGTNIGFAGNASDTQDGNLTSRIVWTSSLAGQLGVGGSITVALPSGTHTITATVTDNGGLAASRQMTLTVSDPVAAPAPTPTTVTNPPVLSASGYKVRNKQKVDLTWNGATTSTVDVYRNGARVTGTTNDGYWTDAPKSPGTYSYKVCAAGACSNDALVTF